MANSKILNTRICLKYDSWAKWDSIKDTFRPLKGEVCVVNPGTATGSLANTPCLMKVGDGETLFSQLPWVSAPAADVHEWAKAQSVKFDGTTLTFYTTKMVDGVETTEVNYSTYLGIGLEAASVDSGKVGLNLLAGGLESYNIQSQIEFAGEDGIQVSKDNGNLSFSAKELKDRLDILVPEDNQKSVEAIAQSAAAQATADVETLKGNDEGKSARAIATEVAKAEIGSAGHLKREIVTELPAIEDADADTIYMKRVLGDSINYSYEESQYTSYQSPEDMQVGEGWTPSAFDWEPVDPLMPFSQGDYSFTGISYAGPGRYFLACEDIYNLYIYGYTTETSGLNILYNTFISTPGGYIVEIPVGYESISGNTKNCTGVYRIPNEDRFIEYMLIEGAFEKIGDTAVNLDGYATEEWANEKFVGSVNIQGDYDQGGIAINFNGFSDAETGGSGRLQSYNIGLATGGVTTEALATGAVTTGKIFAGSVTKDKLATDVQDILDNAIQSIDTRANYTTFPEDETVVEGALAFGKTNRNTLYVGLLEGGVTTEALADGAVTEAKLETTLAEKINNPSILDLEDMSENTTDYVIFNCGSATTLI